MRSLASSFARPSARFDLAALCLLALASACAGDSAPGLSAASDASLHTDAGQPAAPHFEPSSNNPDGASPRGAAGETDASAAAGSSTAASVSDASSGHTGGDSDASGSDGAPRALRLPPINGGLDYQLGGAYAPATDVAIVSRDRLEAAAPGLYNICYINGFQGQPDEQDFWLKQQPDLVLRDAASKPIIDQDWNELLLDVSTADKRARLADIMAGYIAGCASAGYDAVEIDNLDSYARSKGLLKMSDAVAFIALLAEAAHQHGLAIAQKNASELVSQKTAMGTDFVVAEECNSYDECDVYSDGYGEHVLMIEYVKADFQKGCSSYPNFSIVLRDRDLVMPGSSVYVFQDC